MKPKDSNRIPVLIFAAALLLCASFAHSQTSVLLAPIPQFSSYLQNGTPNAFGCVFTYASGTTTPLATYTDSTGVTQNANPVILTAGGTANIWIQSGQAYTFSVKSNGGFNCSAGSTQYTVNGIGGGASTLSVVVPYSPTPTFTLTAQNELISFTLSGNAVSLPLSVTGVSAPAYVTFQIAENATGGYTFAWPSNVIGGCYFPEPGANVVTTQTFVWNGTNATAISPCTFAGGSEVGLNVAVSNLFASNDVIADLVSSVGYQINGSYGAAGQVLTSTGTGSAWANPKTFLTTFTDYAATTSLAAVPGLTFPVAANTAYTLDCEMFFVNGGGSSATAIQFALTGPASPTEVFYTIDGYNGTSSTAFAYDNLGASAFGTTLALAPWAGEAGGVHLHMGLANGANAGNVVIQAASATATGITIKGVSYCHFQ